MEAIETRERLPVRAYLTNDNKGVTLSCTDNVGSLSALRIRARQYIDVFSELLEKQGNVFLQDAYPELIVPFSEKIFFENPKNLTFLIMGAVHAGKSVLVKRFIEDDFAILPKTDDICFSEKALTVNDSPVQLRIGDVPGKDFCTSIKHDGVIVTIDLANAKALDDVELYITHNSVGPLILVGTKPDATFHRKIAREDIEIFCERLKLPYIECSAFSRENVNEVFDILTKMVLAKNNPQYALRVTLQDVLFSQATEILEKIKQDPRQYGLTDTFGFHGVDFSLIQNEDGDVLELSAEVRHVSRLREIANFCLGEIPKIVKDKTLKLSFVSEIPQVDLSWPEKLVGDPDESLPLKITLVGAVCDGRTVLAKRYAHNIYSQHAKASIGIDFCQKTVMIGDEQYRVQLWDTAGYREGDGISAVFAYRYANGVVITVDLSRRIPNSYVNVVPSLLRLFSFVDVTSVPVIMVGTKSDLMPSNAEHIKEYSALAEQLGFPFIMCSAKTGFNVNEAFELLLKMIMLKKEPRCVFQIPLKSINREVVLAPHFFEQLNTRIRQRFAALWQDVFLIPELVRYRKVVKFLKSTEKSEKGSVLKFHVKNKDHENFFVRRVALSAIEKLQEKDSNLLDSLGRDFLRALRGTNDLAHYEARDGLLALGKLNSEEVIELCLEKLRGAICVMKKNPASLSDAIQKDNTPELLNKCVYGWGYSYSFYLETLRMLKAHEALKTFRDQVVEILFNYFSSAGNQSVVKALIEKHGVNPALQKQDAKNSSGASSYRFGRK